jgi:hypothetical protein
MNALISKFASIRVHSRFENPNADASGGRSFELAGMTGRD